MERGSVGRVAAIAVAVAACLSVAAAMGALGAHCDRTWVGGTSGTWESDPNWSPAGDPDGDDHVCIPSGATVSVTSTSPSVGRLDNAGTIVLAHGTGSSLSAQGGTNSGAIRRGASGFATIDGPIVSSGLIDAADGNLRLKSLTVAGTLTIAPGREAFMECCPENPVTFGGGAVVNGGGTLRAYQATSVTGAVTIAAGTTLKQSGGIGGAGSLTIDGTHLWESGAIAVPVTLTSGGTASLTTTGTKNIGAVTYTNRGTVTISNEGFMNHDAAGGLRNEGLVELTNDYTIAGPIVNLGTFRKTGGTNAGRIVSPGIDNRGTLRISSGGLRLQAATSRGTLQIDPGATALLTCCDADSMTLEDGALVTGGGLLHITEPLTVTGAATIVAGTTLRQCSTIRGAGTLTIAGTHDWRCGAVSVNAVLADGATANLTTSGGKNVQSGKTYTNRGTFVISGEGFTGHDSATALRNEALVEVTDDYTISGPIVNLGTFVKTGGVNAGRIVQPGIDNRGTLRISSGGLRLQGATSRGTLRIDPGATALLTCCDTDSMTLEEGALVTGGGTLHVTEPLGVTGAATIGAGTTLIQRATISGAGSLRIEGTHDWRGGTVRTPVTIAPGGSATMSTTNGKAIGSGTRYTNLGTATVTNEFFQGEDAATSVLDNRGTFAISNDVTLGGFRLENLGTLRRDSTDGPARLNGTVVNTGTISATRGRLDVPDGIAGYLAATRTLTGGTLAVSGTGDLRVASLDIETLDGGVTLDGAGSLRDTAGNDALRSLATIAGNGALRLLGGRDLTTPGALESAGTIEIGDGSVLSATSFDQTAGATTVTGRLTAGTGMVSIDGGELTGGGSVGPSLTNAGTVDPDGDLDVDATYTQTSTGRLEVDLPGTSAYDSLDASQAALDGTLVVRTPGFSPSGGDAFDVVRATTIAGTFAAVEDAADDAFDVTYAAPVVRLVAISPDDVAPLNPRLSSPSHRMRTWSSDDTIEIAWTGATDDATGVDGYSYLWDTSPTTSPDTTTDAGGGATGVTTLLPDGTSHYFHLRTVDGAGNWTPGAVHLGPFRIDTTAPVGVTIRAPQVVAARAAGPSWSATDGGSGVGGFQVRTRTATFTGTFGAPVAWGTWRTSRTATYNGAPARVTCFTVQARDRVGNVSDPSAEACTTFPADDGALTRSNTWVRRASYLYTENVISAAARPGAWLTYVSAGRAEQVAIVASVCPGCGRIDVSFGGIPMGRIDLNAAATAHRRIFLLPALPVETQGQLRITTLDHARPVLIDGVALIRATSNGGTL